jgi:endonuclease-3
LEADKLTKSEKRKRLAEIIEKLKELYPNAECALEYGGDPWRLLVMGRLSAQCTDKRVNEVSRELFKKYPTAKAMAEADTQELSSIVRPCGLYRVKAQNIKDASRMLEEEFGGILPSDMDELLRFPGVGRKIANLLIGDIFHGPAIVCDTHCIRICARLGMYPETEKNPEKIERILASLMDVSEGADFCHRIVLFGREVCTARNPFCDGCPLSLLCEHRKRNEHRKEKIKAAAHS